MMHVGRLTPQPGHGLKPGSWFWSGTGTGARSVGKAGRLEVHHVVELAKGGNNEQGNLTTYCRSCHIAHHQPAAPSEWDELIREL